MSRSPLDRLTVLGAGVLGGQIGCKLYILNEELADVKFFYIRLRRCDQLVMNSLCIDIQL